MRVLMISPELPRADRPGSMAPAQRQFASLRRAGVEVSVYDMRGRARWKYLQAVPRIRRLAAEADLLHAHFGYCGWLARCQHRRPVVVSFMGDDLLGTPNGRGQLEPFSRLMVRANRRLARRVDAVIVKSAEMARVVAPVPAYVVPNGVDLEAFQPLARAEARGHLRWPDGKLRVLFPGNPRNPRKGFALARGAVQVAEHLVGQPIELVILWNVPPMDVPLYMNASNAMLMTSLIEGSPNVVKEALACNLPVASVAVGDTPELLAGVDGCRLCERDPEQLGAALAGLLGEHTSSNGRKMLLRRGLDAATVAQRIIHIYEAVLGQQIVAQPPARPQPQPAACAME